MSVSLTRGTWCGPGQPYRARIVVRRLRNVGGVVRGAEVLTSRPTRIEECGTVRVDLPVPAPPFVVTLNALDTFVPAEVDPSSRDTRELAAQVGFAFTPR
jgi:hypothetical protein